MSGGQPVGNISQGISSVSAGEVVPGLMGILGIVGLWTLAVMIGIEEGTLEDPSKAGFNLQGKEAKI